ncbi:lipopolysaccharide biosynthesis protein [Peribacillus frigoritolerans]|uniref:lipopolysaccharide biosynthesis protein n=1 Tax=Peribacillus frigoritolerans TaxID=450367 RepID=UPI002E1CE348|nr:lipopolysaccharide biosynthesis protein [Peribacillus frigoritolerans]
MNNLELKGKMLNATKWSSLTEIAAKIIAPITTMILARILAPESFGVVATITMIVSFADMLSDAGFQKYLVQHQFKDSHEKYKYTNVAFWTNLGISFLLWGIIAIFCERIATMVGNPGLGNVIAIACIQLPLTAFSSIQMALYRRDFDFKTLFWVRLISVLIPFIITIPLAFLGLNYWALIIGTICGQITNAVILTMKSNWKPKVFYSINILKKMLSFSIWSLIESVSIWLTIWVDTFIVGSILNEYYLGLYKTSTTMVNSLLALITAATTPVLFSALSRLQDNNEQFNKTFFKMQRIISILIFPLGVGVFLYSELVIQILLGSQWSEASEVIGVWALTSAITIVFGHYCSEVYRAKGRPKLSFLAQFLHLIVLAPVCLISAKYGFLIFVYARSWIRIEGILVHFLIMKFVVRFPVLKMISNVSPAAISAIVMGFVGYFLQQLNHGVVWSFVSIFICIIFYFGVLYLFPNMRDEIFDMLKRLKKDRLN